MALGEVREVAAEEQRAVHCMMARALGTIKEQQELHSTMSPTMVQWTMVSYIRTNTYIQCLILPGH